MKLRYRPGLVALLFGATLGACDSAKPLRPVNYDPVVRSLTVFPAIIAPGDSAIVVCEASDPDGDTLVFDWESDCRLLMKDALGQPAVYFYNSHDNRIVVYAGSCANAPSDTGGVSCFVRDRRGGGAYAGLVRVVIRQ
jgi:hypothetical protein